MTKIKLTKGELKRQRDALKQFEHYLPILQLKKQHLQLEIGAVHKNLNLKVQEIDELEDEISEWAGLLNEAQYFDTHWIKPKAVIKTSLNIAGVDIPIFERVDFEDIEYDLFLAPLWVDIAIKRLRQLIIKLEEEKILKRQIEILANELRITNQRVNLFEKIKIPEAKEDVRIIRIYLGDQQANAVGRAKIAKRKIEQVVVASSI